MIQLDRLNVGSVYRVLSETYEDLEYEYELNLETIDIFNGTTQISAYFSNKTEFNMEMICIKGYAKENPDSETLDEFVDIYGDEEYNELIVSPDKVNNSSFFEISQYETRLYDEKKLDASFKNHSNLFNSLIETLDDLHYKYTVKEDNITVPKKQWFNHTYASEFLQSFVKLEKDYYTTFLSRKPNASSIELKSFPEEKKTYIGITQYGEKQGMFKPIKITEETVTEMVSQLSDIGVDFVDNWKVWDYTFYE